MANRFTDSRKWLDPWFRKLPLKYKLFWSVLLDTCDHAGLYKVDLELAEFYVRDKLDEKEILSVFNIPKERIKVVREDLWFLPGFIEFQYKNLSPTNNTHISIINKLIEAGVRQGLVSPMAGVKDKDKDKDKEEDEVKKEDKERKYAKEEDFNDLWDKYPRREGKKTALRHYLADVKTPEDESNIKIALKNYLDYLQATNPDPKYIKQGQTWFNNWRDWITPPTSNMPKSRPKGAYL